MKQDGQRKTIRLRVKEKIEIYQSDNIVTEWSDLFKGFE